MKIKASGFTRDELEIIKIAETGVQLYDEEYLNYLCKQIVDDELSKGFFKAYTYKDSLRIMVLMTDSISEKAADWAANEINKYINISGKDYILLRYAQINGFSDTLLNCFESYENPYHYRHYFKQRSGIDFDIDMKGLEKRSCTEDMIDTCIEILEEVFTPNPDPPGTFWQDSSRIKREYMSSEKGGAELFFKDDVLIGFCGHRCGGLTEVCVRKEYQGKGYGEVIVRSVLQSVYKLGYNAELYTEYDNARAIHLYEKVGFKKLYEAKRINLLKK